MIAVAERLQTVPDARTRFAILGIGWRIDAREPERAAKLLQRAVAGQLERHRCTTAWQQWSHEAHACLLTLAVPAQGWESIIDAVTAAGTGLEPGLCEGPLLTLVGPDTTANAAAAEHEPARREADVLASRLHQENAGGYEKLQVTGPDPASEAGAAATFLAVCMLAGGPGALLPAVLARQATGTMLQLVRGLQRMRPVLDWQLIGPETSTFAALDLVIETAATFRPAEHRQLERTARRFAAGNLNRAWKSPVDLASSITRYELMGWGGELVRTPDSLLDSVNDQALQRAVQLLVRPLVQVRGAE